MKYITHFEMCKGWRIMKEVPVVGDDRVMIMPLTEEEVNDIVIKLNQIICQD